MLSEKTGLCLQNRADIVQYLFTQKCIGLPSKTGGLVGTEKLGVIFHNPLCIPNCAFCITNKVVIRAAFQPVFQMESWANRGVESELSAAKCLEFFFAQK